MAQTHSTLEPVHDPTTGVRLVSGALAGCFADSVTFPLDMAKVRLQVQGESSATSSKQSFSFARSKAQRKAFKYHGVFGTISTIVKEEGVRGLYTGINPGLQRQMCFCGVRIGLYDNIKQHYSSLLGLDGANMFTRIAAGITSGGLAVVLAQPTDVVKVRLQAQGMDGGEKRYRGTYHAYKTIFKQEGIKKGLWKGALPNITRNGIVTVCELVSYDMIKEYIIQKQLLPDQLPCHFLSAFGAGFITTCIASPVDVVKTRFMNAPLGKYNGAINCAVKMFREGGPLAFYKGFFPNFMRLGSWNVVMFVTFEQLKRAMMEYKHRDL